LLLSFTFLAFPFNPKNTNIIVHYIGFIIGMFAFFVVSNFLYVKSV
jgi:lipopolysaccharide export LptBFGC system permease protein LptF